jgi:hypothetical protein
MKNKLRAVATFFNSESKTRYFVKPTGIEKWARKLASKDIHVKVNVFEGNSKDVIMTFKFRYVD